MNKLLKIIPAYLSRVQLFHTSYKVLKNQLKYVKGKKHSSQLWLERQLRDPYVDRAKLENFRCRSAFKLIEIQEQSNILAPGQIVIECGASPGSWTQVATEITNANGKKNNVSKGRVIAVDKLIIHPIEGAELLTNFDFTSQKCQEKLHTLLKEQKIDVLLSDMAPNATGIKDMDHENIISLVYSAFKFSMSLMQTGGIFLAKVWDGERTSQLENDLSKFYRNVKIIRPQATRSESSELFLLAKGFKGIKS